MRGGDRTLGLSLRRRTLYPLSYTHEHKVLYNKRTPVARIVCYNVVAAAGRQAALQKTHGTERNPALSIRINRYLSMNGVCSRRNADRLIAEGRVKISGRTALTGDQVEESMTVTVDGRPVARQQQDVLIAFNKPRGIVCTASDRQGDNDIIRYIHYGRRIFTIGRLDKDSEGLILLTNNGDIMNRMTNASFRHEKEYIVDIDRPVSPDFLRKMAGGVRLDELDRTTAPCICEKTGEKQFRIILIQGLNRQIRRMCKVCGARVTRLKRVRVMNIRLADLPVGKWRDVSAEERQELIRELGMYHE